MYLYRLAVRTAPSHGANSGSSPDKVTTMPPNRVAFFVVSLSGMMKNTTGSEKYKRLYASVFL